MSETPILYVAVTGHGFGHASRVAWVLREIRRRAPEIEIVINSSVPSWFFQSILGGGFESRNVPLDVGIIQEDSLRMDLPATLKAARRLEDEAERIVKAESDWINKKRVGLVLADIPPLAADVARVAGLPVYFMGNFGWDFIYRELGPDFAGLADRYAKRYGSSGLLFRLPFSESMNSFPRRLDVGLPGGHPRRETDSLRCELGLGGDPAVLLSFGGMGLSKIPYQNLNAFDGGRYPKTTFLTFDPLAPELPNLIRIRDQSIFPIDLIPLCRLTLSKPGFGIFSDVLRSGGRIACVERKGFAESPILMEALRRHFHHTLVGADEFYSDDWGFLAKEPALPRDDVSVPLDGNERIAGEVIRALKRERSPR